MGLERRAQGLEGAMWMHIIYDNNAEIIRNTHAPEARPLLILGWAPGAKLERQLSFIEERSRQEFAPISRSAWNSRIRVCHLYTSLLDSSCAHHKFLKNN